MIVEIHEPYASVISRFASMRRTLESALSICENVGSEQADWTAKELEAIIPAIEHMHLQIREQLWKQK